MPSFTIFPDENDAANFHDELVRALVSLGWEKITNHRKADYQIYTLHPRLFSAQTFHLISQQGKKVLLRFEPKVVNPLIYSNRISRLYDQVLDIGRVNIVAGLPFVFRWPYVTWKNPAIPSLEEKQTLDVILKASSTSHRDIDCVMVASQKFPFVSFENYSIRSQIAFARRELGVHVYGMNWSMTRWKLFLENTRIVFFFFSQLFFPNVIWFIRSIWTSRQEEIDEIDDKFQVLLRSNFTLVIENSDDYVSEKILDAFVSGSIPIYKGPDLTPFGIPSSAYLRLPNDPTDIPKLIGSLSTSSVQELKQAGVDFCLRLDGLPLWDPASVAQVVADAIAEGA